MPPAAEPAPLLLAIDTSTSQAGLALYDGALVAELTWPAGRHGTETALAEAQRLLTLAGRGIRQVRAVGVALGPGSFSSLRVGLSTAKGLAFALPCPLVGIPTLDIVSYPHRHAGQTVWAVIDAGRTRVAAAPYETTSQGWQAVTTPIHAPIAALVASIAGPALVAGETPSAMVAALAGQVQVTVLDPALRSRRPGVLAELAWRRWQAGQVDDPAALEPLYLHGNDSG